MISGARWLGRTSADLLWNVLEEEGVDVVFGHPGGAVLPVYDALRRSKVRHVLVRHEQGAAHAADGYARVTGRVGVCLATSGPGATNLVTGLATAMADGVPLVAITGQVRQAAIGTQSFQETDIIGVTMPVTKAGFQIRHADEVATVLQEAFRIARADRQGPVLVDFPKCVQEMPCSPLRPRVAGAPRSGRSDSREVSCDTARLRHNLDEVVRLLQQARRPVVMVGRGVVVSGTTDVLRVLVEQCDLPVITTLLGLDAFPATDPRSLGMPGMHGTERANRAIQEADLVLGLGLRFDDRVIGAPGTFAPVARIVHFEVSPAIVGRTVTCDLPVVGDLRTTLPLLLDKLALVRVGRHREWWRRLQQWSRESEDRQGPEPQGQLQSRYALRSLARRTSRSGAVVVTDVGQHQMWMAQELRDADPRTHLTSGGLGTMGYALPAGIGAALGCRERPVWVVSGDGGFQMALHELATVVQERLPLRIAIINNGVLGMVRQWQELFYDRQYSATHLSGPDFVLLAKAFGVPARAVERAQDLESALDWAEAERGPVLLDLRVPSEECVYPIVPSGAALDQLVTAQEEPVTL